MGAVLDSLSGPGPAASRRRTALSLAASAAFLAAHARLFDDAARFAGDTWEYQSVAVNLVKGRGFPKFGQAVPFPEYAFDRDAGRAEHYPRFVEAGREGGERHFYRTPGYPVFLAGIYALTGVRPLAAKLAQSLLLFLVAGSLIWIGRELWGEAGSLAGALAGPVYAAVYGYQAGSILTEPLIAFSLAMTAIAFLSWRKNTTYGRAALLGAAFALSLYAKASNIFVPPFIALLMLAPRPDLDAPRRSRHALAALCATAFCLAPYAVFASMRNGRVVLLSTQGPASLLDNNNEFSLAKRAWAPEWRDDPAAFYNRPEIARLSTLSKVAAFYSSRPCALLRAVEYKLEAGFRDAVPLKAVMALIAADATVFLLAAVGWLRERISVRRRKFILLGTTLVVFCISAFQVLRILPLAALVGGLVLARRGARLLELFPGFHAALLANFVLVFAIFDGAPRFFSVAQPFFTLLAMRFAVAAFGGLDAWARRAAAGIGLPTFP